MATGPQGRQSVYFKWEGENKSKKKNTWGDGLKIQTKAPKEKTTVDLDTVFNRCNRTRMTKVRF